VSQTQSPNQEYSEPVAAVASGSADGAITIIRVSGSNCHTLISKQIRFKTPAKNISPREMRLCEILGEDLEVIDESLVVFFNRPNSFTGEDALEIYCHGGPYLANKMMSLLLHIGIRQAHPGEFTKRAFLNSKLDLSQAEGIKELVNAQTDTQWLAARQLATGKISEVIEKLRHQTIAAMAELEARIDFPDEGDTAHIALSGVVAKVRELNKTISELLSTFRSGKVASQGLRVALIGAPNAGKSTLLNTLLNQERAIVTAEAGTTRDYIEEQCLINGRLIRLIDTAGLRKNAGQIEAMGIKQAEQIAQSADLIIALFDAGGPNPESYDFYQYLIGTWNEVKQIKVVSKADLDLPGWAATTDLHISCKDQTGIESLKSTISNHISQHIDAIENKVFISSPRHFSALSDAQKSIEGFFKAYDESSYDECLAFELQEVARHLQSILGSVDNDDVLDKVFLEFCLGK